MDENARFKDMTDEEIAALPKKNRFFPPFRFYRRGSSIYSETQAIVAAHAVSIEEKDT